MYEEFIFCFNLLKHFVNVYTITEIVILFTCSELVFTLNRY